MEKELAIEQRSPSLTELDSPQGKLIYLYVEMTGGATVTDLHETLAMKKIAILSVLSSLSSQGLVERDGDAYVPRS